MFNFYKHWQKYKKLAKSQTIKECNKLSFQSFSIQATSATLNQPLIAPNEQKNDEVVTIAIECQAYHRTLLLVREYTRQHAPCYVVHGLKKIIADYAYEPPVPITEVTNSQHNKWCYCVVTSFCTTILIGGTFIGCTLYPNMVPNF